jgi:hypothetical protein
MSFFSNHVLLACAQEVYITAHLAKIMVIDITRHVNTFSHDARCLLPRATLRDLKENVAFNEYPSLCCVWGVGEPVMNAAYNYAAFVAVCTW